MKTSLVVVLLYLVTGCASTPSDRFPVSGNNDFLAEKKPSKASEDSPKPETPNNRKRNIRTLIAQYDEWD